MIDGGPARTGRSSDRQPMYRAEVPRSQPEPQPPVERPVQSQSPKQTRPKKSLKGLFVGILILVLVAVVAAASHFFLTGLRTSATSEIDNDKYQAVFLSSGQVYFGDLSMLDGDYMKLSGVFYIQSNNTLSEANEEGELPATTSGMQLIKLGDEVHGPEDAMIINTDQVLFFENLKSDGSVAKLIDQYKQDNK